MKNKLFKFLPLLSILTVPSISSCGAWYDDVLVVYNWEDYIYEGVDEYGTYVDDDGGVCERFEKYYLEKTGKKIKVDYETFSTNEDMYEQIKLGSISPDLICPSDYMIQKMANEGILEPFSYDENTNEYGESLQNWADNGSPFIKEKFRNEKLNNGKSFLSYTIPYFWGTMGFTYDTEVFSPEDVSSWECLWTDDVMYRGYDFKKNEACEGDGLFTFKDSVRDTYAATIFHVYHDEIVALDSSSPDYNSQLSSIFNRCDNETVSKVKSAILKALGKGGNVCKLEVDDGKQEIVQGKYSANLAWSGDAVFSMDEAEEVDKILAYSLPEEGSNIWFDGWCMPKDVHNKELAEEFVNFISDPEIAALSMDAVGYTSSIAGQGIWDLVNDWYASESEDEEEYDECDISYFFGDTIDEPAIINIDKEERGRQFDAQYPSAEQINKCCVMKDFGSQTSVITQMWIDIKA